MSHHPFAAVPFFLKRSEDVFSASTVTSTTETVHGLLRLDGDRLVVQWRLGRRTERVGTLEVSSDTEYEEVREEVVPLASVAGARVREPWWLFWSGPRLVLRAADLQAFDAIAGPEGLRLDHPAELVLRLRRKDRLAAEEFSAELALALAQLEAGEGELEAPSRAAGLEGPAPDALPGPGNPERASGRRGAGPAEGGGGAGEDAGPGAATPEGDAP